MLDNCLGSIPGEMILRLLCALIQNLDPIHHLLLSKGLMHSILTTVLLSLGNSHVNCERTFCRKWKIFLGKKAIVRRRKIWNYLIVQISFYAMQAYNERFSLFFPVLNTVFFSPGGSKNGTVCFREGNKMHFMTL